MPALTTRQKARERLLKLLEQSLDRMIPLDENVPLRGQTFREFEDQVEQVAQAILPALMEERAALEPTALVESAGHCPFCQSDRTYLDKIPTQTEVISPHGPVVLMQQRGRCRCCGRSFSPSATRLGPAGRGPADSAGGGAAGA